MARDAYGPWAGAPTSEPRRRTTGLCTYGRSRGGRHGELDEEKAVAEPGSFDAMLLFAVLRGKPVLHA